MASRADREATVGLTSCSVITGCLRGFAGLCPSPDLLAVLVEQRRRRMLPAGAPPELDRGSGQAYLAQLGMLDLADEALRDDLLAGVDAVEALYLPCRDAVLVEQPEPLLDVAPGKRLPDNPAELVPGEHAPLVGGEALILGVQADERGEAPPDGVVADRDVQHPVTRLERTVGRDGRMVVARGLRHLPGYEPARSLEGVNGHLPREQR